MAPAAGHSRRRRWLGIALVLVALLVFWEAAKWLGGDPWRLHGTIAGVQIDYEHVPPFKWRIADDLSLPHVWDIARAFVDPAQRGGAPLGVVLAGQAAFTFGEALAGFALGGILGLGLGILFVHSRLAERAFVPYVVASQTVPILAIAPLVVVALKADWLSVMAVATYLTFFPVTIASMRGLRAFDPRALELFRSYAATRRQVLWQLRLPTSVPYLFSGLPGGGGRLGHRRDHRRADGRRRLGSRQRDHQLQPVLHVGTGAPVGDDRRVHDRRLRLRRHRQSRGAAPHAWALPASGGNAVTEPSQTTTADHGDRTGRGRGRRRSARSSGRATVP